MIGKNTTDTKLGGVKTAEDQPEYGKSGTVFEEDLHFDDDDEAKNNEEEQVPKFLRAVPGWKPRKKVTRDGGSQEASFRNYK